MATLIYILFLNTILAASAANGKTKIYLKGSEGERLISTDDLACGQYDKQTHIASFRLKPEAGSRAKSFAENNRGIKANLMACGTPFAFHLDGRLSEEGALVAVRVPKESWECVSQAAKPLSPCSGP